jgi:hypothetical protein
MCPVDTATAGGWSTEIWICCSIGGTYIIYIIYMLMWRFLEVFLASFCRGDFWQ